MTRPSLLLILTLGATPALAHTGHADVLGLLQGLAHPLLGTDHLLAMLAVGLWSGFALTGHVWRGAAAFLGAMVVGAAAGWAGVPVPGVEAGIAVSVVVLGFCVLAARRGQGQGWTQATLAMIAAFALVHGHAHATEAAGNAGGYLAGFLIATTALHLAGIAVARAVASHRSAATLQDLLGAGVGASGLWMMAI